MLQCQWIISVLRIMPLISKVFFKVGPVIVGLLEKKQMRPTLKKKSRPLGLSQARS